MSDLEKYMDDSNLEELSESSVETESTNDEISSNENETESESITESKEESSIEDQLSSFDANEEQTEDGEKSNSLMDQLNELGITRQGLPVEFDDAEKVKEYLSKGFDYTVKTQELSDQRKDFDTQMQEQQTEINSIREEAENFRSENQSKITENEVMGQILTEIKSSDPDTFELIANAYTQRMNLVEMQRNNPEMKSVNDKVSQLQKQLENSQGQKQQEENQSIVQDWEKGLSEVQANFGTKLRKLGIKPNWEKVQSAWKNDSSNSTSVKDAFFAIHGDQIAKSMDSQSKLQATRMKSQQRLGPKNNNETTSEQSVSKHGGGTYMNELEEIASRYI